MHYSVTNGPIGRFYEPADTKHGRGLCLPDILRRGTRAVLRNADRRDIRLPTWQAARSVARTVRSCAHASPAGSVTSPGCVIARRRSCGPSPRRGDETGAVAPGGAVLNAILARTKTTPSWWTRRRQGPSHAARSCAPSNRPARVLTLEAAPKRSRSRCRAPSIRDRGSRWSQTL